MLLWFDSPYHIDIEIVFALAFGCFRLISILSSLWIHDKMQKPSDNALKQEK